MAFTCFFHQHSLTLVIYMKFRLGRYGANESKDAG